MDDQPVLNMEVVEWISLDQSRPEHHERVLVMLRDGVKIGQLSMSCPPGKPACFYIPELKEWVTDATHWMTLPRPPR